MPGSVKHGKKEIKEWIDKQNDIKVIIDIGAGSATYPKILGDKYIYKAVEIWEPYIEMFNLNKYYQEIIIGDVDEIELPQGDLIIFGDILEHLEKQDAINVIEKAIKQFKHIIISIPIGKYPSKIHYGNKFEEHKSTWRFKDIENKTDWKIKFEVKQIGIFIK